jgi:5-methyltetrahydrofolate--homocysteine methyltransferase
MKHNPYRELLASRTPIIFDGAMGTQIQRFGVREEDFMGHSGCNEILSLTRPEVITEIHKGYLRAGANVIETNTFGANRIKLSDYSLEEKAYEINKTAASLARKAVAEACCSHACLVCGTMGPTGILLASASRTGQGADKDANAYSFDRISEIYGEQAAALVDGGVDLLLLETSQDLLEVRAAIIGIRRMLAGRSIDLPLQVHATVDSTGRMLMGSDISAFLGAAGNLGCEAVGLNCSTGPHEMKQWAEELCVQSNLPVAMMPNAGMPKNSGGRAVYDMDPREFGDILVELVIKSGLAIVGGCCGTTPEHIGVLAEMLRGKKSAARPVSRKTYVATGISGADLEAGKRPFIIGERLNTQGSKKTKEFVLAKNWDELYQTALEQIRKECRLLDICVATSERDDAAERETMVSLVSFLSERVAVPFCIDTTEEAVFASALRACPGSVLINSINLEHGGAKARAILPMAKEFGCPVIALTIDNEGMAKTVAKKLDVARRIVDLACGEFGLPLHFVYIDPLTFTLATGDAGSADAAKNSLEALFRLKEELPEVRTVMGVSNVSYGLKPASRRVLNNIMLHYAAQAGLDAAIFNPLHRDAVETYDPAVRVLAENLLFNRKPDALMEFISAFDESKTGPAPAKRPAQEVSLTLEQDLHNRIVERDRRDLAALIHTLLKTHEPQGILNDILLPAMALVGEKMNKGDMILPFVLQAAEIMKEAVAILEPEMAGKKSVVRGKIVLATVYGDVHDIGKNLVATILKNQGYEVVDCGKQVPSDEIIAVVKRENPDAVGLSALLVTTSREMARFVAELDRQGIAVPVLIGGAAVNRDFAARISRLDGGRSYAGGVFYAKDAFEAVKVLETLGSVKSKQAPSRQDLRRPPAAQPKQNATLSPESIEHPEIIHPHFYGTSQVLRWDARELLSAVDTKRLFKGYFGGGKLDEKAFGENREKEFIPVFEELKKEIISKNLVDASGLYGIFPVITDDARLVILDPDDFHTQRAEFAMPRVERKKNRSIADYFRPEGDVMAVQIVTIGKAIDDQCRRYFGEQSRYSLGFYLNAIANYLTEQLADKVTAEVRRALFVPADRGRRYSFGYPGLPGVEEQAKLFDLLGVEDRLGVSLTPGFQMVPEHSTMAIFVHHPDAEYM